MKQRWPSKPLKHKRYYRLSPLNLLKSNQTWRLPLLNLSRLSNHVWNTAPIIFNCIYPSSQSKSEHAIGAWFAKDDALFWFSIHGSIRTSLNGIRQDFWDHWIIFQSFTTSHSYDYTCVTKLPTVTRKNQLGKNFTATFKDGTYSTVVLLLISWCYTCFV